MRRHASGAKGPLPHGRTVVSMDIPLDETVNVRTTSNRSSIFVDMGSPVIFARKVFWPIH